MLSRDKRLFFQRWLSDPWRIGVPIPSSRGLARAMASQLSRCEPEEYVVELGPGTGIVTRALCHAGVRQQRLVIIERDGAFMEQLRRDFPDTIVVQGDARDLKAMLLKHNIRQVAAVVSSLPLLSIPDELRHAIVREAFQVIKPDGVFIQYTYGLLSPVPERSQHAIGIRGRVAKRIWRNFPPARVWRYTAKEMA